MSATVIHLNAEREARARRRAGAREVIGAMHVVTTDAERLRALVDQRAPTDVLRRRLYLAELAANIAALQVTAAEVDESQVDVLGEVDELSTDLACRLAAVLGGAS